MFKAAILLCALSLATASLRYRDYRRVEDQRAPFRFLFGGARGTCSKTPRALEEYFFVNCELVGLAAEVCASAWEEFSGAFSGRDPATVIPMYVVFFLF